MLQLSPPGFIIIFIHIIWQSWLHDFFYSLWWCSHISKVAALCTAVFHNFQNHTTSDHDWHILLQVLSTRTTIVFYSLSSLFLLSYSKKCRHGQQQAQLVQHSLNCVSHKRVVEFIWTRAVCVECTKEWGLTWCYKRAPKPCNLGTIAPQWLGLELGQGHVLHVQV